MSDRKPGEPLPVYAYGLQRQVQELQEDLAKALLAVAFYEEDNQALQERAEKAEALLRRWAGNGSTAGSVVRDTRDYLAALSPTQETDPE